MSALITEVSFALTVETGDALTDLITMREEDIVNIENGVYTFKKTFNAPLHSSFGLKENSFQTMARAVDEANRVVILKKDSLPENANLEDFSMDVRVKESTKPYIECSSDWVSNQGHPDFKAKFLCWDYNGDYRLAGINLNSLELYLNDEKIAIQEENLKIETRTDLEENPNNGKPNGEGYIITYNFKNLDNDKTHKIKARIYDNDDNFEEAEGTITIKITAPELQVFTPSDDSILTANNFNITGQVNYESDIYITIKKDGSIIRQDKIEAKDLNELSFSKPYILDQSGEGDGDYTIEVYAATTYNSTIKSETIVRNIGIDTIPPTFHSVKFYPVGSDTPIDFSQEGAGLVAGQQYEIRVEIS